MTSQEQALEGFFDALEIENGEDKSQALTDLTESTMPTFGIENGRDNTNLTLDESSFELIQCPTMMTTSDFFHAQQDEGLRHQYFDEVISVVENKLGCDKVICLDMRLHDNAGPKVDCEQLQGMDDLYAFTKPHTATSSKVTDEIAVSLAGEDHRYQRYTVLSLWRFVEDEQEQNIGQYKQFALMDERSSVKPDDYNTRERRELRRDGKSTVERYYTLNARHANRHKWFYFPNMETDSEAILMKQMDSDWSNPGRMSFTMGVPDPRYDIPAPEYMVRTASEVRMICFWEKPPSGINSMPSLQDVLHPNSAANNESRNKGDRSWLDKIMYGDGKVHEWLGKIESMSAGFMEGTEKMTLAGFVSRAASCQGGSPAPLPLNLNEDGKPEGGYFGRYTKEYMDKYEDEYRQLYLPKFLEVVDSYPSWPPSSKSWARSQMRSFGHREVDRGIAEITCVIVDDSMGMVGTKQFPVSKKKKIIDFLIRNETYMYAAMAQWAPLAYETPYDNGPVKPMGQPPLEGQAHQESDMDKYHQHHRRHQHQPAPVVVEGRDDQPQPNRSKSSKPTAASSHHKTGHRHNINKNNNKSSKYGKIFETADQATEGSFMDGSADSSSSSYDNNNNNNNNNNDNNNNNHTKSTTKLNRSRRLHEEYSQVKERRLRHRRSFSSNDESTESYDEDESELLRYSEQRDGVSSRPPYDLREHYEPRTATTIITTTTIGGTVTTTNSPRRRRHDSPESPSYYTDTSPETLSRYDDDKSSLAYSLESRMIYGGAAAAVAATSPRPHDVGVGYNGALDETSLGSSYTHFQQRESSFRRNHHHHHHHRNLYEEELNQVQLEDHEEQPQMYNNTYNPTPTLRRTGQSLWEEAAEPSR